MAGARIPVKVVVEEWIGAFEASRRARRRSKVVQKAGLFPSPTLRRVGARDLGGA